MCLRLIAETDARSVGDSNPSCIDCREDSIRNTEFIALDSD